MKIKSRLWIEKDGKPYLGYGRIKLLRAVDETASISAAARQLNMSYKKAWDMLNAMNTLAKQPLVVKQTGGKNGGGSKVTDYGKTLIEHFETLNRKCITFLENEFNALNL